MADDHAQKMYFAIFLLLLLAPAVSLEIVCGSWHNCVFERGQGAMKCWGKNNFEQLGYDDSDDRGDGANEMGSNLPLLNIGTGFTVEAMSLGGYHSCAMSVDRAMKCFGANGYSKLGFDGNTTTGDALPFLELGADFNLSKIAVGHWHTCALSTDAQLKCFGRNHVGQCGTGTNDDEISGPPSQITAIDFGTNFTPVDVSTFFYHVCALSQQGTLKCFGRNEFGQLGYGDTTDRGRTSASMADGLPIVDLGSDFIVAAIETGESHSCALSTMKTVKCWGDNGDGQCGTPHSTETGDDLPVLEFGDDFVPMQLALGAYHTCILSESAALICFGWNAEGQLGIGTNISTGVDTPSTLTGIDLGSNFVPRQVAAGFDITCAVSTDDAVKCWGWNKWGQLGLGHTDDMGNEPNEMGDNLPIVDVAWPSPTTASPSTTVASTHEPSTSSPTTPVAVSTAVQTTGTTAHILNGTVAATRTDSLSSTLKDVQGDDEDDTQAPRPAAWSWGIPVIVSLDVCVCVCCVAAAIRCIYVRRQRSKQAAVPRPPPPRVAPAPAPAAAVSMASVLSHSLSRVVFPGAVDHNERKQGEEDIELEMAPIKKQVTAFMYDPDRNYKPEGARASLVTPGVNRNVAVVEEESSDSEELYAGNNNNNKDTNNTTGNSDDDDEDMYDVKDTKTRTAKTPKTRTTKKTKTSETKRRTLKNVKTSANTPINA